ncbi:MAG: ribonuclease HI [Alphaproteobacteria bacterium]|jgi:ribonuclease HI
MSVVKAYTDGACSGNPGPGGWGVFLSYNGKEKELYGSELSTTNNRMELTAIIESLKALKRSVPITIYTDSKYALEGATKWMPGWKAKGWTKKGGLKNVDLWQELDKVLNDHDVSWQWVKGHSGNAGNERADALAVKGSELAQSTLKENKEVTGE